MITEAVVPKVERFDPKTDGSLHGVDAESQGAFLETWATMNVSRVFGFPLWEKEVFQLLLRSYAELLSIFTHYAKSGGAGSSSAAKAMTMQQTELTNLALDTGLPTEQFPIARV